MEKRRHSLLIQTCILIALSVHTGCASIMVDETKVVKFRSDPAGATVYIEGAKAPGITPVDVPVLRKGNDKEVRFIKQGYKTIEYKMENRLNPCVFGNIIFGGVIGLGADAATGEAGDYQNEVFVVMEEGTGTTMWTKEMEEAWKRKKK